MGNKGSHYLTGSSRRYSFVHGEVDPFESSDNHAELVLKSTSTNKHQLIHPSKDFPKQYLAGDSQNSSETTSSSTQMNFDSCGDTSWSDITPKNRPPNRKGTLQEPSSSSEENLTLLNITYESESSSSLSFGDGSAETIINKLRRKRGTSQVVVLKHLGTLTQSSDEKLGTSQLTTSSPRSNHKLPSMIITKNQRGEIVDPLKGIESLNANISNRQMSQAPSHTPGMHGDDARSLSSRFPITSPRDPDELGLRWITPKPSPKIGFTETTSGDVIFTAFIRLKGTGPDEYENVKRTSERRLRGLQTQQNCHIKLYDTPMEQKTQTVHKLRILGPGYREVLRCKNLLPRCILERLVTAHATLDQVLSKPMKRK